MSSVRETVSKALLMSTVVANSVLQAGLGSLRPSRIYCISVSSVVVEGKIVKQFC